MTVMSHHREMEVSQANEGLNIKMFQMKQGGVSSLAISGTGQRKRNPMIEDVLNRRNIMRAYRQVKSNDGLAGVDEIGRAHV